MVKAQPLDPDECREVVTSPSWDRVANDGDCHIWHGARNGASGYGHLSLRGKRTVFAHRVAWVAARGRDVPAGLVLDHICRTPACVNPDHLEPITQRENISRGRNLKTHCSNGHALTEENLRSPDHRSCLTCHRDRAREQSALIGSAAKMLGITRDQYEGTYGRSAGTARRILGGAA